MQDWSYCCEPSSTRAASSRRPDDAGGLRPRQSVALVAGARRALADRVGGSCRRSRWLWRRGPCALRLAGLDDDVGELLRIGEPAQRVDRQLELLALGHGLLADLAGGDLHVLLADGRRPRPWRSGSSAASLSGSSQARRL